MTEKLFWQDAYQREFSANVVRQYTASDGHAVILDRTCFYATSGGQPNDLGAIDQTAVKDVRSEDSEIVHVLSAPLSHDRVKGTIDWKRRFDYMQQHSGQHILSAAFYRLFGAETSSFHLGEDYCSIELNAPGLKEAQTTQAEEAANEIISSGIPVHIFFVDPDEAKDYPLRKQSDLSEALRLVQVGDFDLSPCSGTHVKNTAEVGSVFISGLEKLSQSVKINFLCGHRVTRRYHSDLSILKSLSKSMTTSFDLLPDAVARLQQQSRDMRKELERFKEAQLKEEATSLLAGSKDWNGMHLIVGAFQRPYAEIRFLAQRIAEHPDTVGALASLLDKRAVFFRNPKTSVDLKEIFGRFLAQMNAKGGGAPHFMEAGNIADSANVVDILSDLFV